MQLYQCDPQKNNECRKTSCFINGGDCYTTSNKDFKVEENVMDKFERMLELQASFQHRVDPRFESDDLKERAAFIRDHFVYLDQELQEMLYEIPYFKNWKDYSKMTDEEVIKAYDTAKEELVDSMHFFMNMMLGLHMSVDEMYEGYLLKNKENIRRQDEGYDHTMKHIGIKEVK